MFLPNRCLEYSEGGHNLLLSMVKCHEVPFDVSGAIVLSIYDFMIEYL